MKQIVQNGDAVLREIAKPIPEELFDTSKLSQVISDMKKALDPEMEGVALAAPQIGISLRIFIVRADRTTLSEKGNTNQNKEPKTDVYINPEIIKTSRKKDVVDEGCLSVREIYGTILRHKRVTVRARSLDGKHFERGAGGLLAEIFEHEIDHLNGILFIDKADNLVRIKNEQQTL